MSTSPIGILSSLKGRLLGLDANGQLVSPGGFVSASGPSAGAGITGGVGALQHSSITREGNIIKTQIFVDLTGLASSTTDLDIIGVGASVAYIGRITTAQNGLIFRGSMCCVEVPATGADDVDLYSATEGTGVFDAGIGTLVETALVTSGAAWVRVQKQMTALPVADAYLYLTGGEAGTAATYTAGQFVIELEGYVV